MDHHNCWSLLLIIILHLQYSHSFSWFFSSKQSHSTNNRNGIQLLDNAKRLAVSSNSCWQRAYQNLFSGCSDILAAEEKRSRLAWHLGDCFQKDTGRPSFPHCDEKSSMMICLKNLDEDARDVYLEFYLETTSICHQVQADIFKRHLERLVDELQNSAENAEFKIDNIQGHANELLESSNKVQDSLASIDLQTQHLSQSSKNVKEHANIVLKNSELLHNQSIGITDSQLELIEGQVNVKGKLIQGMTMLHDSCDNMGVEIDKLKYGAVEIENEIGKMGDQMFLKMKYLENKADDVGNITGISLDKQNELVKGQFVAVEGVKLLTNFMSLSLEESRGTLKQLAEIGRKQQEELVRRQKQLEQTHGRLIRNSKTILTAQEDFEAKQSTMFVAIEKLFALHNAIQHESRWIKAFIYYTISIFIIYMFTSTKQTYTSRPRLYLGLCAAFLVENFVPNYVTSIIEQQAWIVSLVRLLFVSLATAQLLYAIYTYRDYETLNHEILLTLINRVNEMERNEYLLRDIDSGSESEVNWSSWIEEDLPEDVDKSEDADYIVS